MKIDELIEKYRLMENKGSIMFPRRPDIAEKSNMQYKETADYLEELKAYREQNGISENVYRAGYKFGYNKAIDDCIEELKKRRDTKYMKVNCDGIELKMLSEKLKGEKQNEDSEQKEM